MYKNNNDVDDCNNERTISYYRIVMLTFIFTYNLTTALKAKISII